MRLTVVSLFFLPILALAQEGQAVFSSDGDIDHYINSFVKTEANISVSTQEVGRFIDKLSGKRELFKSDEAFLHHLFTKTHQRFLKTYSEYASFGGTIRDGVYNCLTGTALYALLLDHFGFTYRITETSYHIFLTVESDKGQVLIESTDPVNGFVNEESEIAKRISLYRQNSIRESDANKVYYRYNIDIYNEIGLNEILGLLHYNLAIVAYNEQQLSRAIIHLDNAMRLYQSTRFEEFSKIMLLSVAESKLETSVKEQCLKKLQSIRRYKMPVVASEM